MAQATEHIAQHYGHQPSENRLCSLAACKLAAWTFSNKLVVVCICNLVTHFLFRGKINITSWRPGIKQKKGCAITTLCSTYLSSQQVKTKLTVRSLHCHLLVSLIGNILSSHQADLAVICTKLFFFWQLNYKCFKTSTGDRLKVQITPRLLSQVMFKQVSLAC